MYAVDIHCNSFCLFNTLRNQFVSLSLSHTHTRTHTTNAGGMDVCSGHTLQFIFPIILNALRTSIFPSAVPPQR